MTIRRGTTFLYAEEGSPKLHLHVVVTEPVDGEAIVVSITSLLPKMGRMIVLGPGDHPFLTHESVPQFRGATFFQVEKIQAAIASGDAVEKEPASERLLSRLVCGLADSSQTPNHIRQYCKGLLP